MLVVQIQCPACSKSYDVDSQLVGSKARCRQCGLILSLPPTSQGDPDGAGSAFGDDAARASGPALAPPSLVSLEGQPTTETTPPAAVRPTELPEQFGRYRIMRTLGRGGMGAVYLAHDTQLDRRVALKVPHFMLSEGPDDIERFHREARAAATLDHPNLCPIYDVGQVDGVHYLTMPYIEGKPLSEVIDPSKPTPMRQAAAVVRKLALALHEAHSRGIIHRDLKPANIMTNRRRELVIMDFGLARRLDLGDARLTKSGALMGTPLYMSPEQVRGDYEAIGPASDIYSLGVILYELLAGRRPFDGPVSLVLAWVLVIEPPRLSEHRPDLDPALEAICRKAMAKKIEDRYTSMVALASDLGDWLNQAAQVSASSGSEMASSVTSTTAAPKPRTRDESLVRQFFADIVIDEEVAKSIPPRPSLLKGGPPPAGRHRWWIAAAAGACLSLPLLGTIFYVATDYGTIKIELNDPGAEARVEVDGKTIEIRGIGDPINLRAGEHGMEVTSTVFTTISRRFTVRRGENTVITVELVPQEGLVRADHPTVVEPKPSPPGEPVADIRDIHAEPEGQAKAEDLAVAVPGEGAPTDEESTAIFVGPPPLASLSEEAGKAAEKVPVGEIRRFLGHRRQVNDVAFSPDGGRAVSGGNDGTVRLWDLRTGEELKVFQGSGEHVWAVAFTPDGRQILSAGGGTYDFEGKVWLSGSDFAIHVWDIESGRKLRSLAGHSSRVECLTISKNGEGFMSCGTDGMMRHWDLATGQSLGVFPRQGSVLSVSYSPDGRFVLAGCRDTNLGLWDVRTGRLVREFRPRHSDMVLCVVMSPDGKTALSSSLDKTIRVWDLASGRLQRTMSHETGVRSIAVSSDGRLALAGSGSKSSGKGGTVPAESDFALRLWDIQTGGELRRFEGHRSSIMTVAFSPDNRQALSCSSDESLILWQLPEPDTREAGEE